MTTILEKLLQMWAPNDCILCCKENNVICSVCLSDLIDSQSARCMVCSVPSPSYASCPGCLKASGISQAFVLGDYGAELQQLIHLLKYAHVRQVASDVAAGWDHLLPLLPEGALITHVPTSPKRQRQRGFDQAELLASALAARRQLRYERLFMRLSDSQQVGASRRQRLKQAEAMFSLRPGVTPKDKLVVLVDDVITTGASVSAAARLARAAGAERVIAVAIAHQQLEKK